MTWPLLGGLALVTIASRVLPMTLLPTPTGRAAEVLAALPAPLFASLFALSLVGDGPPDVPLLAASVAALAGARSRSLLLVLLCGLAGYGAAGVLVG
ncbi:AzlD domain-containing protein [Euzebya tangerina]|uniref:AzlD domain-containing protein n=1 Tax=Euzebya tangerina TaxID=591198 RepID=UPI000E31FF9E|nr:AzlD domain-containing protein [Euzebya tangerina]